MYPARLLSLIISIWTTSTICNASPAKIQHYPITGVHTGIDSDTGARPSRPDILDLVQNIPAWSLCVQALAAMQADSENDELSYYQIAGIHGRPYTSWDNCAQAANAPITGYCTHNSVLFPTWHRPYLALFEQILLQYAQAIAKSYTGVDTFTYQDAADALRLPYWDWAANSQVPDILNEPTVQIMSPTGTRTVPNPWYQYKFTVFPLDANYFPSTGYDGYLASCPQTVRNPDNSCGPNNVAAINTALSSQNIQAQTYYTMTKAPTYDNFASVVDWGPSIEQVHNGIHVAIGGANGHMTMLSYSAFDPLFWLHHCNVDRITAMYEAMNPTTYVTPFENYYGTYAMDPGSSDDIQTPLTPFSSDTQGTYYTSATAQSLDIFGYSYADIPDWEYGPDDLKAYVTSIVNMKYGGQTQGSKRDATVSQFTEWSVALAVSKNAIEGRQFFIRLFLGVVPDDPTCWATSDALVGTFTVMPPPTSGGADIPDITVHNEISLVKGLADRGYDGQSINATAEYLRMNLSWAIQLLDATVFPVEECSSLLITVQEDTVITSPDMSILPVYTDMVVHPEVTQGKAGGYQDVV